MTTTENETLDLTPEVAPELAATRGERGRVRMIAAIAAGALVLAGGGVAAWASVDHDAWVEQVADYNDSIAAAQADAADAAATAQTEWDSATTALRTQIDAGEATLAATDGQVADNTVRQELRDALDAAIALRDGEPTFLTEPVIIGGLTRDSIFHAGSRPEVSIDTVTGTDPATTELEAAGVAVEDAAAAVTEAQAQWVLEQVTVAISNGEAMLAGSEGKVLDNTVRDSLRATLDTAIVVRDAGAGATPVVDTLAQRDAVNAATQSVSDAQAAWQAEQDRIAAEAAAAAAAAAQKTSTATKSTTTSSNSKNNTTTKATTSNAGSGGTATGSASGGGGVPLRGDPTQVPGVCYHPEYAFPSPNGTQMWCYDITGSIVVVG